MCPSKSLKDLKNLKYATVESCVSASLIWSVPYEPKSNK